MLNITVNIFVSFISLVENGKVTFHNCENLGKYPFHSSQCLIKTKIKRVKRKFSPFSHFTAVKMVEIWPSTVHVEILFPTDFQN